MTFVGTLTWVAVAVADAGAGTYHQVATNRIAHIADARNRGRALGTLNFSGDVGKFLLPAAAGAVASLLDGAGSGECDRAVPSPSYGLMNRRMRTRMSGGVEGERGEPAPYPIRRLLTRAASEHSSCSDLPPYCAQGYPVQRGP